MPSGPQLKRVIVLSSCASVSNPTDQGVLNESNWNEDNIKEIKEKGRDASGLVKYRASKSLAEKCELFSIITDGFALIFPSG